MEASHSNRLPKIIIATIATAESTWRFSLLGSVKEVKGSQSKSKLHTQLVIRDWSPPDLVTLRKALFVTPKAAMPPAAGAPPPPPPPTVFSSVIQPPKPPKVVFGIEFESGRGCRQF